MKKLFKRKFIYIALIIIFCIFIYENHIKYEIIINKKIGTHYIIDGENVCYHNYEYRCPQNVCLEHDYIAPLYYSAYFENLYDAVKFAENNYSKYYNSIPEQYIKEYSLSKVYFISSICERNYDEVIYGYAVNFLTEDVDSFYKDHPEYIFNGKAYTFKEVYDALKSEN